MHPRSLRRDVVRALGLLSCLLMAGGCMKTQRQTFAKYRPGDDPVTRTVSHSGVYKIKWTDGSSDEWRTAHFSKRLIREGDPIGFSTAPDGTVLATAGDETFPVADVPPTAKYCAWYYKHKEPTRLGRGLTTVVGAAATTALFVGLGAMALGGDSLDDDECREPFWGSEDQKWYEREKRRERRREREQKR